MRDEGLMKSWSIPEQRFMPIIRSAIQEDLGDRGDITSLSTLTDEMVGEGRLITKSAGILAGTPLLAPLFQTVDPSVCIEILAEEGQPVQSGMPIARLRGKMRSILTAERTALNFIQRLSGIATMTHQFVKSVQHTQTKIIDTRKTTPGMRLLEKYAVSQGGGFNHRMGLYDMILIKDNHIDMNGGIQPALRRCLDYLNSRQLQVPIEIETRTLEEVNQALEFPIQRIMLDNMEIETIRQAVQMIHRRVETEASGNIGFDNVVQIAETGVDFISIGALTHSVQVLDMSLIIQNHL
jgi:nicotinate-nucleotide pyrophosphorylase (carboxylating)